MKRNGAIPLSLFAATISFALAAGRSHPVYVESAAQSGLEFRFQNSPTSRKYLIETMGGSVALLDYDADGWLDVFFVNGAALKDPQLDGEPLAKSEPRFWNRLFHNNHDGTFSDVTAKANLQGSGYGMGVATGDYDNDGFPDLLVTTYGGAILYHNNRDGTFSDVTAKSHIQTSGWTTGAGFFDYDRDGCLDLVVARYLEWDFAKGQIFCGTNDPGGRSYCHPKEFAPASSYLFHNNCDGAGTFSDTSGPSGLAAAKGKALGVAFSDYDDDGLIDISIANDSAPQMLFHNEGDGRFRDVATEAGVAYTEDGKTFSGMGTVFADVDNDARPDIVTTGLPYEYYSFFHNLGQGQFEYASVSSGLAILTRPFSGWGIHVFDFDNDGNKELFVANGHVMDNIELSQPHLRTAEPPQLLTFADGKFVDISSGSGAMFADAWSARGAAFGDLDNDGDIDVVVTDYRGSAHLLRNEGGNRNHWIAFDLRGTKSNRDALGAKIRLTTAEGKQQYAMVSTAGSYLSANDRRVFFGLGQEKEIRDIEIRWPSGTEQTVSLPEPASGARIDRIVHIEEPPPPGLAASPPGKPAQPWPSREAAQAELQQALALVKEGKNSEALRALRELIRLDPDLIDAHFSLGVLLARLGRQHYDEAFTEFVEVLRLNPRDVDAHINLSNLLEAGNNLPGAIAEMRKAIDLAPGNAELYMLLGQKKLKAYRYPEAADSFRQALAAGSQDPRAHAGLGAALKRQHDLDAATRELEVALKLKPNDAYSHLELAGILIEQDRAADAVQHLDSATRLQPELAEAWFELGTVYRRVGRADDSAAALRRGLALRPGDTAALYQLAAVSSDKRESSAALAKVNDLKARAEKSSDSTRLNAEGMRLMEEKRLPEALEAFRKALASDPGFATGAYNSGVALAHQGKSQAAIEAFRQAIRIDPGFAAAHRALGLLLESAGDPNAKQELRAAAMLESLAGSSASSEGNPKPEILEGHVP